MCVVVCVVCVCVTFLERRSSTAFRYIHTPLEASHHMKMSCSVTGYAAKDWMKRCGHLIGQGIFLIRGQVQACRFFIKTLQEIKESVIADTLP